eukprot:6188172-Pleurochrysis_carterae.AAC.3
MHAYPRARARARAYACMAVLSRVREPTSKCERSWSCVRADARKRVQEALVRTCRLKVPTSIRIVSSTAIWRT